MHNEKQSKEEAYVDLSQMPQATLQGHMWRQEGIWLKCQSCTFEHGMFIEPGHQLYGIDKDGKPLIRKIEIKP